MKKLNPLMLMVVLMFLVVPAQSLAQQPDYAKWGDAAVLKTKQTFPNQKVVDYAYQGKVYISESRVQYNFIMTLESDSTKKDIRAYVLVNPKSNQLIDIFFD